MRIKKILIANRGEIARRIIACCQKHHIKSVAIYSSADQDALHVREADEAYCVGEAASASSYLHVARIMDIARTAKVDAIHPGYGFLSENPELAKACDENHIVFIGPSAEVIHTMGHKSQAKTLMAHHRIPVLCTA